MLFVPVGGLRLETPYSFEVSESIHSVPCNVSLTNTENHACDAATTTGKKIWRGRPAHHED